MGRANKGRAAKRAQQQRSPRTPQPEPLVEQQPPAARPPPPPPAPFPHPAYQQDYTAFQPSQDTLHWLYSLPLPPGCDHQPLPQTHEQWALVEQYRLLTQGLLVMGAFERERQRREAAGEDPYTDWDPRDSGNPAIVSAAHSLFRHDMSLQQHYPMPEHPAAYPSSYGPGDPEDDELYASYTDGEGSYEEDEDYDDEDADDDGEDGVLATHTYDFPTLETLQSFASASPLDPSALPLSLDLSALTLGPNGLGDANEEGGTPASLPSLMSAIAELEQCVARLSLEATEARNLQKSLREEMATRQGQPALTTGGGADGGAITAQSIAAGLARAGMRPMKKQVKGGRVVSVSNRGRLPSHLQAAIQQQQAAAQQAVAAATAAQQHQQQQQSKPAPLSRAASKRPEVPHQLDDHQHPHPHPHSHPHPHDPHSHDHCTDCGTSLSRSASPTCSCSPPASPSPPTSAPASPSVTAAAAEAAGLDPHINPATNRAWEDGELMKALQSVSMLDRRADEYRERLRVLKEQIHHHAALADALASSQSAQSAQPAQSPAAASVAPAAAAGEKSAFGHSVSDTTLQWVSVDERRRELLRGAVGELGGEVQQA